TWLCIRDFNGALVLPTPGMLHRISGVSTTAAALYGAWFLLQVILQMAAPVKIHEGGPLSDGTRLKYRMNGWFSFWFTMAAAFLALAMGWIPATILHDQFGSLLTTVNIFAFVFSLFLYRLGKASKRSERRSGNAFYDYFMGSALNPRIGEFDLKLFCEARPGLILWVLINLSFAAKQYELHGAITTPMILVHAF